MILGGFDRGFARKPKEHLCFDRGFARKPKENRCFDRGFARKPKENRCFSIEDIKNTKFLNVFVILCFAVFYIIKLTY